MTAPDPMGNGPVIHDRRRIDPVTGQVRRGKHAASKPAGTSGAGRGADTEQQPAEETAAAAKAKEEETGAAQAPAQGEPAEPRQRDEGPVTEVLTERLATELSERTADLQRLQAEYANYRKRVDRDRATVKDYAVSGVLTELLPVLDAIGQARDHGELSGGFKSVADTLQAAVAKLGLVTYGEKGDPFDPKIHEALTHSYSSDVTEDTCVEIFQPGYKVGERVLRPARVAVAEPATGPDGSANHEDAAGDAASHDAS